MILGRLAALFLIPLLTACAVPADNFESTARPAFQSDRIEVTVVGIGPDVVLIPGLGSSPQVWESTIAAMPEYRYHLIHISGFAGASANANGAGPIIAPVAEEIARYITSQRLNRPAVVGHSLGGSLAMMVAAKHPATVSKVMVVDMLPFAGAMFGADATSQSVEPIAAQLRTGIVIAPASGREATIQQTIASMVKTESLRASAVADGLQSDPVVSGQSMYDLITTDLRTELKSVSVPMSVLWVHPPSAQMTEEQMAGLYRASYANVPDAKLTQIPDSYHFIMFDAPERFQRELAEFLDDENER